MTLECDGRQDKVFYTSPTIRYSGLRFYAEPVDYSIEPPGNDSDDSDSDNGGSSQKHKKTEHKEENSVEAKVHELYPGAVLPLPPGWVKRESRSTPGQYYYVNEDTGESGWEKPLHTKFPVQGQVVLQCMQKPDTFVVQDETMQFRSKWPEHAICPHTREGLIERKSDTRGGVIPYGLLLRTFVKGAVPQGDWIQDNDKGGAGFCSPIDGPHLAS